MAISKLIKGLNTDYDKTFSERTQLLKSLKSKQKEDQLEKGIERVKKSPEKILEKEDDDDGIGGIFKKLKAAISTIILMAKSMILLVAGVIKFVIKSLLGLKNLFKKITNICHKGALKKMTKKTKQARDKMGRYKKTSKIGGGRGAIIGAMIAAAMGGIAYSMLSGKKSEEEEKKEEETPAEEKSEDAPAPAPTAAAPTAAAPKTNYNPSYSPMSSSNSSPSFGNNFGGLY